MNLVFDLDGTVVDAGQRMYQLFRRLAPLSTLSYQDYWECKRAKMDHATLLRQQLGYDDAQVAAFQAEWMALIETPAMLALDKNFAGLPATLEQLRRQATLHLCTARQLRQPVLDQLQQLGLQHLFSSVMVTEQRHSKAELIAAQLGRCGADDWMLGDTGRDIEVGRQLGMRTCAVLSGFLSRASLLPYQPDLILERAADFTLPPPASDA